MSCVVFLMYLFVPRLFLKTHPLNSPFLLSSDFLDTHIYLTRGWKDNQAFAIMLREGDEADAITGLQAKTTLVVLTGPRSLIASPSPTPSKAATY